MVTKKNTAAKKAADKTEKKTVSPEVIYDVLHGKYGAPEERNAKLRAAGFNPSIVTKKINDLTKLAEQIKPLKEKAGDFFGCVLCILDD